MRKIMYILILTLTLGLAGCVGNTVTTDTTEENNSPVVNDRIINIEESNDEFTLIYGEKRVLNAISVNYTVNTNIDMSEYEYVIIEFVSAKSNYTFQVSEDTLEANEYFYLEKDTTEALKVWLEDDELTLETKANLENLVITPVRLESIQ
jgi:hypothetical protein